MKTIKFKSELFPGYLITGELLNEGSYWIDIKILELLNRKTKEEYLFNIDISLSWDIGDILRISARKIKIIE